MIFVIPTAIAVAWLLRVRGTPVELFAKSLSSAGFVAVALSAGALDTSYGRVVLVGLALGALGDVALVHERWFMTGLVLFAGGHIAYVWAFAELATPRAWAVVSAIVIGMISARWLLPNTSGPMTGAVAAYALVISAMLASALSVTDRWLVPFGGTLFVASDLLVARERFVQEDRRNARYGLPIYYIAQVMIALSVAT